MSDIDIIGHQAVQKFLERSLESGRQAQAYLFVGAAGLGKKKLADWFIDKIIKKSAGEGPEGDPSIGTNRFAIRFVERMVNPKTGKKNKDISIDQIHEARDFLSHHAFIGKIKAVVIEGVESLNQHAANALLKFLEEPKADSLLILLAEDSELVLPTIVSRCQVVRFQPVPAAEIYTALIKLGLSPEAALEISRLSFGLPGRAITFYREPQKLAAYQKQSQDFIKILSCQSLAETWRILETYFNKKKDHQTEREELVRVLENWSLVCRDLLLNQVKAKKLTVQNFDFSKAEPTKLVKAVEKIRASIEWLNQNIHPKLVLDNLILDIKL